MAKYEMGYPKKPSKRVGGDKKRPGKWGKSAYWKAKQRKEDISFRDAMTKKGSIEKKPRKMKKGPHSTMAGYGAEGQRTLNRELKAAGHDQGDYNPYNPKSKKNPLGHKGTYYKGSDSRLKAQTGGRAGFQHGGRTNLLEELGRVEGERSNKNRRAEVSRVHRELNKGYKSGGAVLKGKKVGIQIK
jgi:hypothetical protein